MLKIVNFFRSLIPFESLTITTSLTFSEVLRRLDEVVTPPKPFRITLPFGPPPVKPYEGTISGNTFRINRIITGRNSFIPIIKGDIHSQPFGCSIQLSMNLDLAVIVFMIVWMSMPGSIGMLALLVWLVDRSVGLIFLPLFGMCIFAWFLSLICFKIEAKKDIKFFSNKFS